jgi:hypothetical protein
MAERAASGQVLCVPLSGIFPCAVAGRFALIAGNVVDKFCGREVSSAPVTIGFGRFDGTPKVGPGPNCGTAGVSKRFRRRLCHKALGPRRSRGAR